MTIVGRKSQWSSQTEPWDFFFFSFRFIFFFFVWLNSRGNWDAVPSCAHWEEQVAPPLQAHQTNKFFFSKKETQEATNYLQFPVSHYEVSGRAGRLQNIYSPSPTGGTWHRLSWNAMEKVEQQSSFTSWRFNEWQNKSKWIKGGVRGRSVSPTLRPEWEPSHAPVSSRFVTRDGVGRAKQQKEKQTLGRRGEISSRKKKTNHPPLPSSADSIKFESNHKTLNYILNALSLSFKKNY